MNDENDVNSGLENSENNTENHNPEFDQLLIQATKTKEQERHEEAGNSAKSTISDEKAAKMAVKGIAGIAALANQLGGYEIEIPNETMQLSASLFCPLIQKYGNKFKVDPDGVDLNGWMPEVMALGGVGVLGITVNRQIKSDQEKEVSESGNQPEHG